MPRTVLVIALSLGALAMTVPAASAGGVSVLAGKTVSGQAIPCTITTGGVRVCHGDDGGPGGPDLRVRSFDGVPLEIYLILPPAAAAGTGGGYPLVVQSHGWAGRAGGILAGGAYLGPSAARWAARGYAVLQLTARGFGDSCGQAARAAETPAHYAATCSKGYVRLDDERYEAHDVQYAIGLLVDEGIVDPGAIGVTGPSYGGGVSLELASLKDRVMGADGKLSAWRSPAGKPLRIAAAAPVIPWSDLAYSLEPNGRTLDYRLTGARQDLSPVGIEKQSFEAGLYALGRVSGYYSAPGSDPQADLTTWYATVDAGEPYGAEAAFISNQIAHYHSPYYLLQGSFGAPLEPPAALLIANGFTDDLFGTDEALRYYNLERALYPSNPIELVDGDFGHMRAQNKPGDVALLSARIERFFDRFLRHAGPRPRLGATATIETCPSSAPSGGPFWAPTWAGLHPGEVDFSAARPQTVVSGTGDPAISAAIDPVAGQGACATVPAADQTDGVASYRLPAAVGAGYTLLGSPTVIARLSLSGSFPELAERLWDVDPARNTETLVARGLYRPLRSGLQVFQLHPGAWHFAAGHIPKLELLAQDARYGRASNGKFSIVVRHLRLRLPVHERPGGAPAVGAPAPPVFLGCSGLPQARVRSVLRTANGITVSGTASDRPCPADGKTISSREHVTHVYLVLHRRGRRIELLAHGTRHWSVRLRALPPFAIRLDAVDALHQHHYS